MRVFPDTNVWASALMGHGRCRDLLERLIVMHSVVLGAPVREELHRILTEKLGVPRPLWEELDQELSGFELAPASSLALEVTIPDPDDAPILACALTADVEVFVTGDKELVDLERIEGMDVVQPRALWRRLSIPEG